MDMKADAVGILLLIILLIEALRLGIARMQASRCIIPIWVVDNLSSSVNTDSNEFDNSTKKGL